MYRTSLIFILFTWLLIGCSKTPEPPVTIAINPWPGYELMYLAEVKGFFKLTGANVKLVQLDSLSDVQRAYINGHVDGMASTVIEAVQATHLSSKPLKIIMIPDYSNGGDVIIGPAEANSMTDLKGKKMGAEVSSLGIFILQRALSKHSLTLEDVEVVNTKQEEGLRSLKEKHIDAFVTYAPISIEILKNPEYKILFTSAEIPFEIIDTISVSEKSLTKNPKLVTQLRAAWQLAVNYMSTNPKDAYAIMAEREGISPEEFKATLSDLLLLTANEQNALFKEQERLQNAANQVCSTLVHAKAIETDCSNQPNIIHPN